MISLSFFYDRIPEVFQARIPNLYENDIRALLMATFTGEKIIKDAGPDPYGVRVCFCGNTREMSEDLTGTADEKDYDSCSAGLRIELYYREELAGCLEDTVNLEDIPLTRDTIKRTLYRCLTGYTGKSLPWGTLTGIRPAKLVTARLAAGMRGEEVLESLYRDYYMSPGKAQLCLEVAENEREILSNVNTDDTWSMYIGIPFCPTICAYCSFSSFPLAKWKNQTDAYVTALIKELNAVAQMPKERSLLCIYMGGGTPTSLEAEQLDVLLTEIDRLFGIAHLREMTVEAGRPDSITRSKLQVLKNFGISRISINPQTMQQKTLDVIGRKHTVEQVREAFILAREMGFDNINMDLIAGLPGEDLSDMQDTLAQIEELSPDSLTVHSLAMKRAAWLNQNRETFSPAGQDTMNGMIDSAREAAYRMHMRPYYMYRQKNIAGNLENVGYARAGCEGLYNMLIMEEKQSICGVGAGAASKMLVREENRIERTENVKNVTDYLTRIDEMISRKANFLF